MVTITITSPSAICVEAKVLFAAKLVAEQEKSSHNNTNKKQINPKSLSKLLGFIQIQQLEIVNGGGNFGRS
jgi:hypothetical protein